jgi:hypothetical protein
MSDSIEWENEGSPLQQVVIDHLTASDMGNAFEAGPDSHVIGRIGLKKASPSKLKSKDANVSHHEEVAAFLIDKREEISRQLEINLNEERTFEEFEDEIIMLAAQIELLGLKMKKIIKFREGDDVAPNDPILAELYSQYSTIEKLSQELQSAKIMDGAKYDKNMFAKLRETLAKMQTGFDIVGKMADRNRLESRIRKIEDQKGAIKTENTNPDTVQDINHKWEISEIIRINVGTKTEDLEDEIKSLAIGILAHQKNLAAQIGVLTNEINGTPGLHRVKTGHKYPIDSLPLYKQLENLLRAHLDISRCAINSALAKNHIIELAMARRNKENVTKTS